MQTKTHDGLGRNTRMQKTDRGERMKHKEENMGTKKGDKTQGRD